MTPKARLKLITTPHRWPPGLRKNRVGALPSRRLVPPGLASSWEISSSPFDQGCTTEIGTQMANPVKTAVQITQNQGDRDCQLLGRSPGRQKGRK